MNHTTQEREDIRANDNPIGMDGIEFIEYATSKPQALGQVLEMMGFRPVARHRSREVLLYRQGAINIIVNAHGLALGSAAAQSVACCGLEWLVILSAVGIAKVLSDCGHPIDHGDQGAVYDEALGVCDLDLKLPASQT